MGRLTRLDLKDPLKSHEDLENPGFFLEFTFETAKKKLENMFFQKNCLKMSKILRVLTDINSYNQLFEPVGDFYVYEETLWQVSESITFSNQAQNVKRKQGHKGLEVPKYLKD